MPSCCLSYVSFLPFSFPTPLHPYSRPILNCFCHMIGKNHVTACQVSYRSRQPQYAQGGMCREMQLLSGCFEQFFAQSIGLAEVRYLVETYFSVAGQLRILKA